MRKVFVEAVVLPEPRFRDGLGIRYVRTDSADDPVEVLRPLWDVAAMRASIQHRVGRLLSFRQARFVSVRAAEVPPDDASTIEIVSDYVSGHRFSEILEAAAAGVVILDSTAALHVVREVLGALAVLHESRGVTHGALAPERILLTPKGRVVVADYVLGPAIERLDYSRTRLWREFRIPVAPGQGAPKLDEAADVVQVGVTAAALLAGRPIDVSEYPSGLPDLVASLAQSRGSGGTPLVPAALVAWMKRALHLDPGARFVDVREARMALEGVLSKQRAATGGAAALKSLAEKYGRHAAVIEAEAASRAAALAATRAAEQAQAASAFLQGQDDGDTAPRIERGTVLVPAFTLLPDAPIEPLGDVEPGNVPIEEAAAAEAQPDPPVGWRVPEPAAPDVALVASPLIQDETPPPPVADEEFPEEVLDLGALTEENGQDPEPAPDSRAVTPMAAAEAADVAVEEPTVVPESMEAVAEAPTAITDAAESPVQAPAPDIPTAAGERSVTEDVLDLDAWLAEDSATLPALRRLLHGHETDVATDLINPAEVKAPATEGIEPQASEATPEPVVREAAALEHSASEAVVQTEPPSLPEMELAAVEAEPEIAALFLAEGERPFVRDLIPVDTMPAVKPLPLPEVDLAAVETEPEVAALFRSEEVVPAAIEPPPVPEVDLAAVEAEPEIAAIFRSEEVVPAAIEPPPVPEVDLAAVEADPDVSTLPGVEPPVEETEPAIAALFRGESSVLFVPGRAAEEPPATRADTAKLAHTIQTLPDTDVAELLLTNWLVEVDLAAARRDDQREPEPPLLSTLEPPAAFLESAPAVDGSAVDEPGILPQPPVFRPPAEPAPEPKILSAEPRNTTGRPEASLPEPKEAGPVFPRVAPSVRRVRVEARRRRLVRMRVGTAHALLGLFQAVGTVAFGAASVVASFLHGLAHVLVLTLTGLWTLARSTARVTARGFETAAAVIARGGAAAVRGVVVAVGGAAAASAAAARTLAGGFLRVATAGAAALSKTARSAGSAGLAALWSLSRAAGSAARAGAGIVRRSLSGVGRGAIRGAGAARTGAAALAAGLTRTIVAFVAALARGAAGIGRAAAHVALRAGRGAGHAGSVAGPVLADGGRRAARAAGRTAAVLWAVPGRMFYFLWDLVDRVPRPVVRPSYFAVALLVIVAVAGVPYARARWFTPAPPVGTIRVEAQAPGLTVRIDGEVKGAAPLSVTLAAGRHRVEVEGGGLYAGPRRGGHRGARQRDPGRRAQSASDRLASTDDRALGRRGLDRRRHARRGPRDDRQHRRGRARGVRPRFLGLGAADDPGEAGGHDRRHDSDSPGMAGRLRAGPPGHPRRREADRLHRGGAHAGQAGRPYPGTRQPATRLPGDAARGGETRRGGRVDDHAAAGRARDRRPLGGRDLDRRRSGGDRTPGTGQRRRRHPRGRDAPPHARRAPADRERSLRQDKPPRVRIGGRAGGRPSSGNRQNAMERPTVVFMYVHLSKEP